MYSSNQILVITGDRIDELSEAIRFAVKYDNHKIEDIVGVSSINGGLYFGRIPQKDYKAEIPEYDKEYIDKWQMTFTNPLMAVTENTLLEVIDKWLRSEECTKIYEAIWKEENCGNWDTPTKGWKLTGFDDYNEPDSPTFGVFKIEPYWTEYED